MKHHRKKNSNHSPSWNFKPSLAIESPPQLNEVMLRSLDGKTYPDHRCTKWKPLLPSGKRLHNYGKLQFFMGKSTNYMAIFNSYVKLPEGN